MREVVFLFQVQIYVKHFINNLQKGCIKILRRVSNEFNYNCNCNLCKSHYIGQYVE